MYKIQIGLPEVLIHLQKHCQRSLILTQNPDWGTQSGFCDKRWDDLQQFVSKHIFGELWLLFPNIMKICDNFSTSTREQSNHTLIKNCSGKIEP